MSLSWTSVQQTVLGTLFTWGLTALGSFMCILHSTNIDNRKLLDGSLGFSAGVMLAASFWSLLSPAEEMALQNGYGVLSFLPLAVGLLLGALFVFLADRYVPLSSFSNLNCVPKTEKESLPASVPNTIPLSPNHLRQRKVAPPSTMTSPAPAPPQVSHRLLLMMLAITMHNIPEGLAVGVAFGAVGTSPTATAASAWNLALGIGIQNFPEGLAVSLPLRAAGMSFWRSVWFGQLSGLVEPLAGLIGCVAVQFISPLLPYALSFAAGAMVYVVLDDIIPESQERGNGHLSSATAMLGFVVMMCLDMGLG